MDAPNNSFESVVESFGKLLHFEDADAIRVLLASIIANALPTDPVWLFLVAPSASSKSELVRALEIIPNTLMLSSLTPQTFISGMRTGEGKPDPSLLNNKDHVRLGTVFLLKDFTTILNMRLETKAEIMAQLREIFDGKISKAFGTGVLCEWEGKVGFISGVTYEIEDAIMTNSKFGDRFLYYKLNATDTRKAMKKVKSVLGTEKELRKNITEKVRDYYASVVRGGEVSVPDLPESVQDGLMELCCLVVKARGAVARNSYSKDIERVSQAESPMRMFKELLALGQGLSVLRGGTWDDADWKVLAKVAYDAVPSWRVEVLNLLAKQESMMGTNEVGVILKRPTRTMRPVLEDLECFGLVDKNAETRVEGEAYKWMLSADARKMLMYLETQTPKPIPEQPAFL